MAPTNYGSRVAAEVRAEMARQRRSGTDLAKHLGVTQSTLSRRLTGEVAFDLNEIYQVADWLGVPLSQLTGTAQSASAVAS